MDLQAFELVILRSPPEPHALDEAALQENQRDHLAYYTRLRDEGAVVTNGPLRDQPDTSLRAMAVFRTGSLDTARQLAERDPAVRAGRFAVEVMTYWCNAGTMNLPGQPFTLPDP
jgi:uncharacterized protein YciI